MSVIVVSINRAAELSRRSHYTIRTAIHRGRLKKADAFLDGTVVTGVEFESLAEYFGWSPATCEEILIAHMVPKGARAYLTVRDPNEPARAMTYGDAARRAEVEATYADAGE